MTRGTPRIVWLKDAIAEHFPELEAQERRLHVLYTWRRHLTIRLTRRVRERIIEPTRFGYFDSEHVMIQLFPPLEGKRVARMGGNLQVLWGPEVLCGYEDPQSWLHWGDGEYFPTRPALRGYPWFVMEAEDDGEYALSLLKQAVTNAKTCIMSRRIVQPTRGGLEIELAAGSPEPEPRRPPPLAAEVAAAVAATLSPSLVRG